MTQDSPPQLSLLHVMPKVACIDVPALPLQLAMRTHPEWKDDPLVIVETDRPTAKVLWANRPARAINIHRGLSFSQAKTLAARLRAQVVTEDAIQQAVADLFDVMLNYTPAIEPVPQAPGLFFADPNGLGGLFGDLLTWAQQLHHTLLHQNYISRIAIGFSRPWLYTLCRAQAHPCHVSACPDTEREQAMRVPLVQLHLTPTQLTLLGQLGIHTVGDFVALPAGQLRTRYGPELSALHRFLRGESWTPLQPTLPTPPIHLSSEVDPPDTDITRLLFGIKGHVQQAIELLSQQTAAITACTVTLRLEYTSTSEQSYPPPSTAPALKERIETAAPTLDTLQVVELLRLRLSQLRFTAPVAEIGLDFEHIRVHPKQLQLQRERHSRDLTAANRALSRLKAMFNDDAVTQACLRPGHLPEAQFSFESKSSITLPTPRFTTQLMPLVRSVIFRPKVLPLHGSSIKHDLGDELAVKQLFGPYRIAGGWWSQSTERDYYFAETRTGEVLWIFYDRIRRRWSLHGHLR